MSDFISIFSTNIILLSNEQKEAIVVEMLMAKRPIREIAKEVHMSFSDIGEIKRRVLGESVSYKKKKKLSKVAQALELFSKNKTPIEVSIELDLDPKDVEKIYLNYLGLNGLRQLVKIYQELGNYLPDFISFYWSFIEAGTDSKKIKEILAVTDRLPDLNLEIKNRQNEGKNLDIQIKNKNIILHNLDNEIKVASDILSTEYSNLDSVHNEISDCRMQLEKLKKLMKNVENEDEYKNLEKNVEDMLVKIINDKSINLPLILIAVFETLINDPTKYDVISNYLNEFKKDNVNRENLQLKENYLFANNMNLLQEIGKKMYKVYYNKIISEIPKTIM